MSLVEESGIPYLFVPPPLSQPPQASAPGGTKRTSFFYKGTLSLTSFRFPQVWKWGTLWEDKSSKNVSVKDGTSEGVREQASAQGHWEEGRAVLTSKSLQGPDTE